MRNYINILIIVIILGSIFNPLAATNPNQQQNENDNDNKIKTSCVCEIGFEYEVDGLYVKFFGKVNKGDYDNVKYEWTFGDESESQTGINPEHHYKATGIYNFTLKAIFEKDGQGIEDSCTKKFSGTVYAFNFD